MNFVNTDLQKNNNKLDMKVDMNSSEFQRILDMISNSDLYKKEFFTSSFQHNIHHIQKVMFFSQIIAQNEGISEKILHYYFWQQHYMIQEGIEIEKILNMERIVLKLQKNI